MACQKSSDKDNGNEGVGRRGTRRNSGTTARHTMVPFSADSTNGEREKRRQHDTLNVQAFSDGSSISTMPWRREAVIRAACCMPPMFTTRVTDCMSPLAVNRQPHPVPPDATNGKPQRRQRQQSREPQVGQAGRRVAGAVGRGSNVAGNRMGRAEG